MAAQQAPERLVVQFAPEIEFSDVVNVEVNFDTFEAGKILWFMDKTGMATYGEAVRALCMCGLGFTVVAADENSHARVGLRLVIFIVGVLAGGLIDHDLGW